MKYTHDRDWRVREFSPEDKPSLLRLSRRHYGEKEQAQERYVDWLYNACTGGHSFIAIAEEIKTGEVLGFSFQVPFPVQAMGRQGVCRLGCNALVDPNYRRQGIYFALTELVDSSIGDTLFTYGFPKPRAITAHEKVGKFQVGPIPLLVRPLDIGALTSHRLRNPLLRWTVNAGWRIGAMTFFRPLSTDIGRAQIEIRANVEPDARFDAFWGRIRGKYDIIIPRDSRFLGWRFVEPRFRKYSLFVAETGGIILAYMALRVTDIEGISIGLIMDLLVEPSTRGELAGTLLIQRALDESQAAGTALAGCLMLPHTQEYSLLRRMGFVEPPERLSPQAFRLMASNLSSEIPDETLANRDHWFVTMANHDAV
jgi:GNAT superfamily N-acetyltransferase